MRTWTDSMQLTFDNMENATWEASRSSNPVYCLECEKMLAEDASWCEDSCAFCNTDCMRSYLVREGEAVEAIVK